MSPVMRCVICGKSIGLWGGLNGSMKTYWKHQVNTKIVKPHRPKPTGLDCSAQCAGHRQGFHLCMLPLNHTEAHQFQCAAAAQQKGSESDG